MSSAQSLKARKNQEKINKSFHLAKISVTLLHLKSATRTLMFKEAHTPTKAKKKRTTTCKVRELDVNNSEILSIKDENCDL